MKDEKNTTVKWYDNARAITTLIIITILAILVCSQSIAVVGEGSLRVFSSVINHNTSYLLLLIYFISIKTHFGKKYFNYFNVFIIFIYLLLSVTSFLTIIQSFSFNTIVEFLVNIVLLVYLSHTMFRDTRVWKEFKFGDSPFNEIPNEYYFSTLLILITFSLIVNLISTVVLSGLIVSILDAIYIGLLSRYIYLYREYLDDKKLDSDNKGNFDNIKNEISQNVNDIKKTIDEVTDDIKDKTNEIIDKYDIDEKVDAVKDKLVETGNTIKDKTEEVVDKLDIDEKVDVVKDKLAETGNTIKDKTEEVVGKQKKSTKKKKVNTGTKDKKEKTKVQKKNTDSKKKGAK